MRDRLWLVILTGALVLGLWFHAGTVAGAAAIGLLLAATTSLWGRGVTACLRHSLAPSSLRLAFGDDLVLTVTISNDKLLPVPLLRVEQPLPDAFEMPVGTTLPGPFPFERTLLDVTALGPYERLTRRYRVRCARRGVFDIRPARLEAYDPFGLVSRAERAHSVWRIVVFAKVRRLKGDVAFATSLGARAVPRGAFEDPSFTVGVRPYRPGDPARSIAWRSTARRGELLVREVRPSADPGLGVILQQRVPEFGPGCYRPDSLEYLVSVAASILVGAAERGGFALHAAPGLAGRIPLASGPKRGRASLALVLEQLAALSPFGGPSFAGALVDAAQRLPAAWPLTVLLGAPSAADLHALAVVARRRSVRGYVLDAGVAVPTVPGVQLRRLPFEPEWSERDALVLVG